MSLADLYHKKEQHELSDEHFEKVLFLDPENTIVLNNYAYYLSLRKSNLEKAKSMSYKCNELESDNSTYQDTYAWVLYQQEDYKNAKIWLEKAISNGGDSSAVIIEHYGDVLYKLGNLKEARKQWIRALDVGSGGEFFIKKQLKGFSMNKFVIIAAIILCSCGIKNVTTRVEHKNQFNKAHLTQTVIEKNSYLNYNWLHFSGKVDINTQQISQNIKINIKSKKDSLIWVSFRSLLGIEVARVKLTKDSLYIINRLAKTYSKKHISILKTIPGFEYLDLTFQQIQGFILTGVEPSSNYKIISDKYARNYPFLNDLPDEEFFVLLLKNKIIFF